jgi:hypothetical protein
MGAFLTRITKISKFQDIIKGRFNVQIQTLLKCGIQDPGTLLKIIISAIHLF